MKTIMRCLVLTLALAVGAFAETRVVEIPNLDKFQSSGYKTLNFSVAAGEIPIDVLFVFDTKEDEYEDLLVAFQCPAGDSFVFKYGFDEEILISKADTSSLKIPQTINTNIFRSCFTKIRQRANNNQLTKADDAFLRKDADNMALDLKKGFEQFEQSSINTSDVLPVSQKIAQDLRSLKNFTDQMPPAMGRYYKEAIKKHLDEKTIDAYFKEWYN